MLLALTLMAYQLPAQNFPAIDRPGIDPLLAADVRSLCPSPNPTDRSVLAKLEERQARLDVLRKGGADAWTALGCTRALLSGAGAISHESTLMIAGDSWAQGAIRAFAKALSIRPNDRHAADALAILGLNEGEPRDMAELAAALAQAANAGVTNGPTLRACADFALRTGQRDFTRSCAVRALATAHDSTWHLLLLSRLSFRDGDTIGGTQEFVRAATAAHDTVAKLDIAWHLQWFVSPEERTAWAGLPDSARGEWVRDHLASRDVRDGQPAGARLAEHFKRLEYADSAFRLSVAKVLRTSMLTKPSDGMSPPASSAGFTPPGVARVVTDGAGLLMNSSFRDYLRWQVDFDDRGVVWMRFGAPLKRQFAEDTEVWYYEIDGKPLLLTFRYEKYSGSSAPSRLVTGHIGDVYCGIDTWRCLLSMRQTLTPDLVQQVREQDREYVSAATTNDDNSVRTDKTIEVISRLHRLWDPVSGAPMALLTYAVKPGDLVAQPDNANRTTRVEFDFRRWDAAADRWQDTAFTRRFTFAATDVRHLTGFFVTPSSPDVSSWSLVATQSNTRRGRAWDVTTGPLDRGPLVLSDLVLGQDGQGLVWANHNTEILLAPLNAVDRHLSVSLYYQIRSVEAHQGLRTAVAFYRIENGVARDSAALQVGFDQAVRPGVNEVAPTLDVSRLDKGSYQLEVLLTDDRGVTISRRTVQLNLF